MQLVRKVPFAGLVTIFQYFDLFNSFCLQNQIIQAIIV